MDVFRGLSPLALFLHQTARKHAWGLCWPGWPRCEAWDLSFESFVGHLATEALTSWHSMTPRAASTTQLLSAHWRCCAITANKMTQRVMVACVPCTTHETA